MQMAPHEDVVPSLEDWYASTPLLTLESTAIEVGAWLSWYGWDDSVPLFLAAEITGPLLPTLPLDSLMQLFGLQSIGSALKLQSLARDTLYQQQDCLAEERFKDFCPVGMNEWLEDHHIPELQSHLLEHNVCGRGCSLMTPEILVKVGWNGCIGTSKFLLARDKAIAPVFVDKKDSNVQDVVPASFAKSACPQPPATSLAFDGVPASPGPPAPTTPI